MIRHTILTSSDDIPKLVTLGQRMHGESVFRNLNFDPDKAAWQFLSALSREEDTYTAFVEKDGVAVGMISGEVFQPLWSNDAMARELIWYMAPECRGSLAGPRLMRGFARWAQERKLKAIWAGALAGINDRSGLRFLTGSGFDVQGNLAVKSL